MEGGGCVLRRNVKRFREGLVFKAHRLVYHSTLDSRIRKKNKFEGVGFSGSTRPATADCDDVFK